VPTGCRAPLGYRPTAARRDRSAAPTTGLRGGPSLGAVHVRCRRLRAGLRGRLLGLLTPLPLALPPSRSVSRAAAGSHALKAPDEPPETRHHEFGDPRCKRCVALDPEDSQ
jgi:hypothetical protein